MVLHAVRTSSLPTPYPSDVQVRGWRFELDHERLEQSDTWALAPPDMRPWLLMLWLTAWKQRPAGSFSPDHAAIAARIGMDLRQFNAHADILLRGFRMHADGRLYHPVIVEQVKRLLECREGTAKRVRSHRNRMKAKETRNALLTRESRVSNPPVTTPEPEPEPEGRFKKTASSRPQSPETVSDGPPPCPHQSIIALYHETLPTLPRVRTWEGQRPKLLASRWREDPQRQDPEWWRGFFQYIAESRFLTGRIESRNGSPPFVADLEWIVRPANFQKINEGKYHR